MFVQVMAMGMLVGMGQGDDPRNTTAYWSQERIKSARPADLPPVPQGLSPSGTQRLASPAAMWGVPRRRVLTPGGDSLGYAPVPRPYTGARRLTGVLLSHDPVARRDIVCAAAVLASRSRSLVLTSAHCLSAGGRMMRHVAFLPAYNSRGAGEPSLGVWPAVRVWVPKQWKSRPYSASLLPYDVGLAGVVQGGRRLEGVTGRGLRPEPAGPGVKGLDLLGYPMGGRYPGTDMHHCVGDAAEVGGVLVTRNCHSPDGGSGGPAVRGRTVYGVVSSSSPLRDPAGFTVLTRLEPVLFGRLLTGADRYMRRRS